LEEDSLLSLSPSLLVADRQSGYIFVLVSFRLGIFGLILIYVLIDISDRLSSDCFWAHP